MKPISQFPPRRPNAARRLRRTAIALLAASAFSLGASAPASALTFQEYIEYKIFVVQCALLLITDPVAHLEVCGVGDTSGMSSLVTMTYTRHVPDPDPDPDPDPYPCMEYCPS